MFNLPRAGKGLHQQQPAHTLLKHQGQPQEALPDQLPKFTVTPVPPNGPGKEFGWGRTWISPVAAAPAWAGPARAAPEGSTEPSLVTNSIKTHPGKKGLAQSEPNPGGRIPSSGCQPRGFGDTNTGRGINNLQTFKNWVWHWSTPQNQHQGFKPEAQF